MIGAQRARAARARYRRPGTALRLRGETPGTTHGKELLPSAAARSYGRKSPWNKRGRLGFGAGCCPELRGKIPVEQAGRFGIKRGRLLPELWGKSPMEQAGTFGIRLLPEGSAGGALEPLWSWEGFRDAPGAAGREAALLRHGEGGGWMWRVHWRFSLVLSPGNSIPHP